MQESKIVEGHCDTIQQHYIGETTDKNNKVFKNFIYKVADVNEVVVQDKNDPNKTYKTKVSFISWYPCDSEHPFNKTKIDTEGRSSISNITCFTTNSDGEIMQRPFFVNNAFGYVLKEFTTDGVFMADSMSSHGRTPPGKRIKDHILKKKQCYTEISTLKSKEQIAKGHYEQNPKNLTEHDNPVFKLIEKTMRYATSKSKYRNKDCIVKHEGCILPQGSPGIQKTTSSPHDQFCMSGHYIYDEPNQKCYMQHNDLNLVGESKISNLIIGKDINVSNKEALDIVDVCTKIFDKDYIYLLDKDNKIKKISLDLFLKKNFLNFLHLDNTKKIIYLNSLNLDDAQQKELIDNFITKKNEIIALKVCKLFADEQEQKGKKIQDNVLGEMIKQMRECKTKDELSESIKQMKKTEQKQAKEQFEQLLKYVEDEDVKKQYLEYANTTDNSAYAYCLQHKGQKDGKVFSLWGELRAVMQMNDIDKVTNELVENLWKKKTNIEKEFNLVIGKIKDIQNAKKKKTKTHTTKLSTKNKIIKSKIDNKPLTFKQWLQKKNKQKKEEQKKTKELSKKIRKYQDNLYNHFDSNRSIDIQDPYTEYKPPYAEISNRMSSHNTHFDKGGKKIFYDKY